MRFSFTSMFWIVASVTPLLLADEPGRFELKPQATASTQGILLSDLVTHGTDNPLPRVVLAPPPQIGRAVLFTRAQLNELLSKKVPDLVITNWTGADRVKVVRATKVLTSAAVSELLTSALQGEQVKDRGELELRLLRPWNSVILPDEALSVKILEAPTSGVSANFLCRFEIFAGGESSGVYQQNLQAKIWKDVYVAHSNIQRGQLLREADVTLEKRDILVNREYVNSLPMDDPYMEFRDGAEAGSLINPRQLRLRTVIKRGRQVEALFQDSSFKVSVRAEALEDGVRGQVVRLRNVQSRREFKGKVQDEQTVAVLF